MGSLSEKEPFVHVRRDCCSIYYLLSIDMTVTVLLLLLLLVLVYQDAVYCTLILLEGSYQTTLILSATPPQDFLGLCSLEGGCGWGIFVISVSMLSFW